jgi:hypothetical protein
LSFLILINKYSYKPGLHILPNFPNLPDTIAKNSFEPSTTKAKSSNFNLSPYLLLPDSFGDIYFGERFSAYIAVVNGFQNIGFYQVSLAVRLQTANTVVDLFDIRQTPNTPISTHQTKSLLFNETTDIIVQQALTELGTHTLRVTVQYISAQSNNEPKTIRKFYRFNVLQPLQLTSNYLVVNQKPMIQCQVTNATKCPVYIEEVFFVEINVK